MGRSRSKTHFQLMNTVIILFQMHFSTNQLKLELARLLALNENHKIRYKSIWKFWSCKIAMSQLFPPTSFSCYALLNVTKSIVALHLLQSMNMRHVCYPWKTHAFSRSNNNSINKKRVKQHKSHWMWTGSAQYRWSSVFNIFRLKHMAKINAYRLIKRYAGYRCKWLK